MKFIWSNPKWRPSKSGLSRRAFLGAGGAALAAPLIVGSGILMPVKSLILPKKELLVPTVTMILEGTEDGRTWFTIARLVGREGSVMDPSLYLAGRRYQPRETRVVFDREWKPREARDGEIRRLLDQRYEAALADLRSRRI